MHPMQPNLQCHGNPLYSSPIKAQQKSPLTVSAHAHCIRLCTEIQTADSHPAVLARLAHSPNYQTNQGLRTISARPTL